MSKNVSKSLYRAVKRVSPVMIEGLEGRRMFATGPVLALQNLDGLPSNNRLIFSKIQHQNSTVGDTVHDTSVLRLRNTGNQILTISSIDITGPWTLVTSVPTGTTIAANRSLDITVRFTANSLPAHNQNQTNGSSHPNGGAVANGTLTINSNDATNPRRTVTLAGYWQNQSENTDEPNTTTIVNKIFGYTTVISNTYRTNLTESGTSPTYYGEEVISPFWARASTTDSVAIQMIAAYHTQGNSVHTYWYNQDTKANHQVLSSNPTEGQTVLPHAGGSSTAPALSHFTPPGSFGFRVDGEYSDDSRNGKQDQGGGHHIRFYPLRDAAGNLVANTYLMTMDYAVLQVENFDFQDNVYIISNVRPATAPPSPTNLVATGGTSVNLSWTGVTGFSTLAGYNVYRAGSATGTYTKLNGSPLTATTYTDSTGSNGNTFFYKVTAVDNSSPALESTGVTAQAKFSSTVSGGGTSGGGGGGGVTGNTGPFSTNDTFDVTAGVASIINVLSNDGTTTTGAELNSASVTIISTPTHGTATVDSTSGLITYTGDTTYSGADTLTYTVADTNGDVSTAATVTFNVVGGTSGGGSTDNPSADDDKAVTSANVAVIIEVLANDSDNGATLLPGTVTITTDGQPAAGTVSVDTTTGAITYTPNSNFVGGDQFSYTVSDSLGHTSGAANVAVNVGVLIGTGKAKSLVYTASDGTVTTTKLAGPGFANVLFAGSGNLAVSSKGLATVTPNSGKTVAVAKIAADQTTAKSTLSIRTKGARSHVTLGGVTSTTLLGKLDAPTADLIGGTFVNGADGGTTLSGALNVAGINTISLRSINAAALQIGTLGSPLVVKVSTSIADASLNSGAAVKSFTAPSWTQTGFGLSFVAPALTSLSVKGDFAPDLIINGDLRSVKIGGIVTSGLWSVGGNTASVNVKTFSASEALNFTFTGSLASFVSRVGGISGDVSAGDVKSFKVVGDVTGNFTANSVKSAKIIGNLTGSTFTVGGAAGLTALSVTGAITSSSIIVASNVGSVTAQALLSSMLEAGAASNASVTNTTIDNLGTATIKLVKLTSKTGAFANSNIVAHTIKSAALGTVTTDNGGTPEGIATNLISSLSAKFGTVSIKFGAKQLANSTAYTDALTAKGATPGDFQLVLL